MASWILLYSQEKVLARVYSLDDNIASVLAYSGFFPFFIIILWSCERLTEEIDDR